MLTIDLARGDIKYITFTIYDSTDNIVNANMTNVYFTVKKDPNQREPIIQKTLKSGTIKRLENVYALVLNDTDTDYLGYGSYWFDIELERGDVLKQTFTGRLLLTEEITHPANEGV